MYVSFSVLHVIFTLLLFTLICIAEPTAAPSNVVIDVESHDSIRVEWEPVEPTSINGKIVGYMVSFMSHGVEHLSPRNPLPSMERLEVTV